MYNNAKCMTPRMESEKVEKKNLALVQLNLTCSAITIHSRVQGLGTQQRGSHGSCPQRSYSLEMGKYANVRQHANYCATLHTGVREQRQRAPNLAAAEKLGKASHRDEAEAESWASESDDTLSTLNSYALQCTARI